MASDLTINAVKLKAELSLLTDLKGHIEYIEGDDNKDPDFLSRPQDTFGKKNDLSYCNLPYLKLLQQICKQRSKFGSWRIFLPTKDLLWTLSSVMSSRYLSQPKIPLNKGHAHLIRSILSGGVKSMESTDTFFL